MFLLLVGHPPYQGSTVEELMEKTLTQRIVYDEDDWKGISSDALLLVKNMLAKNPEERISVEEVLAFSWVSKPPKVIDCSPCDGVDPPEKTLNTIVCRVQSSHNHARKSFAQPRLKAQLYPFMNFPRKKLVFKTNNVKQQIEILLQNHKAIN